MTQEQFPLNHNLGKLEEWSTPADYLRYVGRKVTVFDAKTGQEILTGTLVVHTDLLGSAGILEPDLVRGQGNIAAALRFPKDPREFERGIGKYRFRVEKEEED